MKGYSGSCCSAVAVSTPRSTGFRALSDERQPSQLFDAGTPEKHVGCCRRYPPWGIRESLVCRLDRVRVQTRRVPCAVSRWHREDRPCLEGVQAQHRQDVVGQGTHGVEAVKAHQPGADGARDHWVCLRSSAHQRRKKGQSLLTRCPLLVDSCRQCVEYVSVDFATKELHDRLSSMFPRLWCLCEDPVHLVMKFKTANGYYASPASYSASRILAKFSKRGLDCSSTPLPLWLWQPSPVITEF